MGKEEDKKMKKKMITIAVFVLSVCLIGNFLLTGRVGAVNCKSDALKKNSSTSKACGKERSNTGYGAGGPACGQPQCGTMWINSSNATSGEKAFSAVTEVNSVSTGKMNIYLHGAVFYTSASETSVPGGYIYVVKRDSRICGADIKNYKDYPAISFCSGKTKANCKLNRPTKTDPFQGDIKTGNMTMQLDLDKLKSSETADPSTDGDTYTVKLQVYRCYGTFTPNNSEDVNLCKNNQGAHCGSDTTTFKVVIAPLFIGRSMVTNGTNSRATAPLRQFVMSPKSLSTKAETLNMSNCSEEGCNVTFNHYLTRETSTRNVRYSITRVTTGDGETKTESIVDTTFDFKVSKKEYPVKSNSVSVKPGHEVCETLTFWNSVSGKNEKASSTVCASAEGSTKIEASLDIKAKKNNQGDDEYRDYCVEADSGLPYMPEKTSCKTIDTKGMMYAKPTDKITYKVNYDAAPQSACNMKVDRMRINGNNTELWLADRVGFTTTPTLKDFYNKIYTQLNESQDKDFQEWNNAFSYLYSRNDRNFNIVSDKIYNNCDSKMKEEIFNSDSGLPFSIADSDVGKVIVSRVQTNHAAQKDNQKNTATTPSAVEILTTDQTDNYDGKDVVITSMLYGDMVFDIQDGANVGSNVQLYHKNGTAAQTWRLELQSDGYYKIKNPASGKYIDLKDGRNNGNPVNKTNIQVHASNDTCAQRWKFKRNGDGSFTIHTKCYYDSNNKPIDGMVIDVAGGLMTDKTNIQIYNSNNTAAQRWILEVKDDSGTAQGGNSFVRLQTTYLRDEAYVAVPYNFNNTTDINTKETVLYAGEIAKIGYEIIVGDRENSLTGGTYATIVPNASYGITIESVGGENFSDESYSVSNQTLNKGENVKKDLEIPIPDVPAGTEICFRSWVWPKDSEQDDKMDTNWSDGNIYESGPKCFVVAKRPSIQVWGGNVYSNGNINTSVSGKSQLAGYNGDANIHYFGSFGELGVLSTGAVNGFASGAAMGYVRSADGNNINIVPNYAPNNGIGNNGTEPINDLFGGSTDDDMCVLTFAEKCNNNNLSNPGLGSMDHDKNAVLGFLKEYEKEATSNGDLTMDLNGVKGEAIEENTYLYYHNGNLTVSGGGLGKNMKQFVHVKGNITIGGNIEYTDTYNTLDEMPKMVLYAENGDVNINCNVTRLDILIIADKTVDTCPTNENDYNNANNSIQLKVNGAIIANELKPNRTYGAATGKNSIIPAEIINFDPSLYLWNVKTKSTSGSETEGESSKHLDMEMTDIIEIAPRY